MQERIIKVLIPTGVKEPFDYKADEDLLPGTLVKVPFGSREIIGAVWNGNTNKEIAAHKLKKISLITSAKINEKLMSFLEWVAKYNVAPLGEVLSLSLFPEKQQTKRKEDILLDDEIKILDKKLSPAQEEAAEILIKNAAPGKFSASLIDGVTGSGKTEVYFKFIENQLAEKNQILILLPEIALTNQIIARVKKHFGFTPALWHSSLSPKMRRINYKRIVEGKARIVVGARSALFLPFKNLSSIIIDEEHDTSYKQEDGVIYNARDMAVVRAKIEEIPIILVSATPSIESMVNAKEKKYHHIHLPERFGIAVLPEIEVVDMRREKISAAEFISVSLKNSIEKNLEKAEQTLIYLNRRGYAPLTLCRKCGHRFQCPSCSAWLVTHLNKPKLQCHHCGYSAHVPKECPSCKAENSLVACGPGVERIEEEVRAKFPNARTIIMASDNLESLEDLESAIKKIENSEVDIIIGTQVIAKGHHFPKITLVGIIDADLGMAGGDLRAAEKTYQVLAQVSGRAGREELKGKVILQSHMPENSVIDALIKAERDEFLSVEINSRKENLLPPFGRLAGIIISGKNDSALKEFCRELANKKPDYASVRILGPAPAPMFLLKGRYRYRFLIRTEKNTNIQAVIKEWLAAVKTPSTIRVKVDIDPYNFV